MKKILSIVLAVAMVLSMSVVVWADYNVGVSYVGNGTTTPTDPKDEPIPDDGNDDPSDITTSGTAGSDPDGYYTVSVPMSTLTPGGDAGAVTIEGRWGATTTIKVTADTSVTLTDGTSTTDPLAVTFTPIDQVGKNVYTDANDKITASSSISVANFAAGKAPAFGTWQGTINFYLVIE